MDVGQFQGRVEVTLEKIEQGIDEIKRAQTEIFARLTSVDTRCADHRVEIGERFAVLETRAKNGNGNGAPKKHAVTLSPVHLSLGAGGIAAVTAGIIEIVKLIRAGS